MLLLTTNRDLHKVLTTTHIIFVFKKAKTDGEESLGRDTVSCQKKKSFPKIQCETEIEKSRDRDEELQEMSLTPILNSLFEVERDFQV